MRLEFTLTGVSPILMHNGAAGIDARSALKGTDPIRAEIHSKDSA